MRRINPVISAPGATRRPPPPRRQDFENNHAFIVRRKSEEIIAILLRFDVQSAGGGALFLANCSAPFAGSTLHGLHQTQKGRPPVEPQGSANPLAWWRRGESNPRPKILYSGPLRAFPVIWVSSPGTLAGKVPFGPSREKARPSAPREEASGYPVRVTSLRLYGHSTVGGRRLKPPELTDSRWRLLVSRFLRGAGPRHATHEHRHPRRSRFAPFCRTL